MWWEKVKEWRDEKKGSAKCLKMRGGDLGPFENGWAFLFI